MKKIFFLLGFVFLANMFSFAQTGDDPKDGTRRIDAIKIAYLTKELDLSPDEAKAFWPVYDRYTNEIKSTLKDSKDDDVLVRQQKLLDIRKKYKNEFVRVLSQERVNRLFMAENRFAELLKKDLQERRKNQMRPNRKGF